MIFFYYPCKCTTFFNKIITYLVSHYWRDCFGIINRIILKYDVNENCEFYRNYLVHCDFFSSAAIL